MERKWKQLASTALLLIALGLNACSPPVAPAAPGSTPHRPTATEPASSTAVPLTVIGLDLPTSVASATPESTPLAITAESEEELISQLLTPLSDKEVEALCVYIENPMNWYNYLAAGNPITTSQLSQSDFNGDGSFEYLQTYTMTFPADGASVPVRLFIEEGFVSSTLDYTGANFFQLGLDKEGKLVGITMVNNRSDANGSFGQRERNHVGEHELFAHKVPAIWFLGNIAHSKGIDMSCSYYPGLRNALELDQFNQRVVQPVANRFSQSNELMAWTAGLESAAARLLITVDAEGKIYAYKYEDKDGRVVYFPAAFKSQSGTNMTIELYSDGAPFLTLLQDDVLRAVVLRDLNRGSPDYTRFFLNLAEVGFQWSKSPYYDEALEAVMAIQQGNYPTLRQKFIDKHLHVLPLATPTPTAP